MKRITLLAVFISQIIFLLSFGYAQERMYFDRATLRDPFVAPENFEKSDGQNRILLGSILDDIEIMGIVIKGNNKYAILNNSIVREKEMWQELLIDKIEKGHIVIIYRGLSTTILYERGIEK